MSMEEFCSKLEEKEENQSVDGEEEEQSDEEDQGGKTKGTRGGIP